MPSPLLAPIFVLSTFALGAQEEGVLERARTLLQDDDEKVCRKGTDLCVEQGGAAAVELLLELLRLETDRGGFLPSAHYRDVVWDGLRRMPAGEARARVRQELDQDKKNPWMRQWCAELLGEYGDAELAESLIEAVDDEELGVQRAAARALGRLRLADAPALAASAGKELRKRIKDKDPVLRANALEALARLDPEGSRETLLGALADKDAGVRCALLAAAAGLVPDAREELVERALQDADWRPRLQAVDVLGEMRTSPALHRLVGALGDARPAVVARATSHLQELTGEKHTRREAWEDWWRAKGEGFDFSKGRQKAARTPDSTVAAAFSGIVFESDHTAFLIDVSKDMTGLLKSMQCTKAEAALKELEATLSRLQGRMDFSLFTYAGEVTPFSKKGAVALTPKSQEKALEFVREQHLQGSKDIWQALEAVLADPAIDTVFLLSSGEPEIGLYVHWNRVTWHLSELNRFRKVVVHAIAYSDSAWYREQLEKIAACTGGEFRYFE